MKRFLAVLALATAGAIVYVTAAPGGLQASPTTAQFTALKKQVAALQRTTKQLKKADIILAGGIEGNYLGEGCAVALTADELQNTWLEIDHLATNLGQVPIFGSQTVLNDKRACEKLSQPSVPRMPINPAVTPSVAPYFTNLINWLEG
jgi:hypothetical protein